MKTIERKYFLSVSWSDYNDAHDYVYGVIDYELPNVSTLDEALYFIAQRFGETDQWTAWRLTEKTASHELISENIEEISIRTHRDIRVCFRNEKDIVPFLEGTPVIMLMAPKLRRELKGGS